MAYVKSISEVLNEAASKKTKKEKIEVLRENNSLPLRNVLVLMYDKSKEFLIPDTPPPYNPSPSTESQGSLLRESRKFKYFVKGFSPDNIPQLKREQIFIEMLETIDKDEAELVLQMVRQEPIKGLTKATINEAFAPLLNGNQLIAS